jgi:hypothetical protein
MGSKEWANGHIQKPTTEDLAQPVLGELLPEHADCLDEVGHRVWESNCETKEPIWLTAELV